MDTMLAFGLEDTVDMMSGFDQEGTADMMLGLCHVDTDCFVLKQLIKILNSNLEKNGHLIMHESFCGLISRVSRWPLYHTISVKVFSFIFLHRERENDRNEYNLIENVRLLSIQLLTMFKILQKHNIEQDDQVQKLKKVKFGHMLSRRGYILQILIY